MRNRAQDPRELFDVLLADGTPTGRVKERVLVHRDGDWHRALHVWIAGRNDDGPFLLAQRRSLDKDTWPGRLDVTVGGHYRAGEGLDEVLREVEEEIGIAPTRRELRFLGVRIAVSEDEPGVIDHELEDVFLWRNDQELAAYRPNLDELIELVRLPLAPLIDLLAGARDDVRADALNARDGSIRSTTIKRDDFIPTVDRYFYRCAIAASLALRGESHVAV